jgi:two-component system, sensor histidine kinase RpfC
MDTQPNSGAATKSADASVMAHASQPGAERSRLIRSLSGVVEESLGEIAQAKIRFGVNFLFAGLGLLAWYHEPALGLSWVITTFMACLVSAVVLYIWAVQLGRSLLAPEWRVAQRVTCILMDNLAITWLLYFGGQSLAGAYGLYLWITIGYGMRFGLQYLYGNLAASLLAFAGITLFSPFWSANPSLSMGLLLALLVVPLYAGYLIRQLHSAVAESRMAYAAKSDFVARMSHELRTPLHGIISVADLLARTEATTRQRELFRIISVSSNTLLDLINRILEISKFEDGRSPLPRQPMNLYGVIHEAFSILLPQAQLKGLSLEFFIDLTADPWIKGAPLQLQEVLINICGNAVKFTETGEVRLKVSVPTRADGARKLLLDISDTGPGISRDHLANIFQPFYQADGSVTRKHEGTGLGTAIALELVKLMDGDIAVESEPGRGTRFKIELPFESPQDPADTQPALPQGAPLALLGNSPSLALLGEELGIREVPVQILDDIKPDERLWLTVPPAAIIVDLGRHELSAASLRENLDGPGEEMYIPVFATGAGANAERAMILGYNCFIDLENLEDELPRALSLAAEFRRDYVDDLAQNESLERIKVLVAEDNLTNQAIARMALSEAGFQCTVVSDGEQALAELSAGRHDIALIDMHMPLMDGMEVARLYNFSVADPEKRIPIVMVTADSRSEIVADADLAGITRFLTKPLRPTMMIEMINRLMLERGRQPLVRPLFRPVKQHDQVAVMNTGVLDMPLLQELLDYMEGTERVEFFREFMDDAKGYIETLEIAPENDHGTGQIRAAMHALSGAARTLGTMKLAAYARRIEFMSAVDIRQTRSHLVRELWFVLQEAEGELRKVSGGF